MKKAFLALVLLATFVTGALAQGSMTDKQVVEYIKKEYAKGTSQKQIVVNLMKKGVTTTQLQRVRKKVEDMQQDQKEEMSDKPTKKNRSRSNQNLEEKKENRRNNRRQDTDVKQYELKGKQFDDMRNEDYGVNKRGMRVLDEEDSLYYWVEEAEGAERQIFGHNIFNNEELSFQPSSNMATPANYTLGAGDEVFIDIWGASQQSINEIISPDGTIVIEGVGPISLGGLSVSQAKKVLKSRLGERFADCSFSLSVGETRTVQVQVMGEVNTPGTYQLNGLSTAFNALYAAGGISKIGTLRDIKVYRKGRLVSTIDVYDYLVNGNSRGDVRLEDNDVILVGPYDCLVQVTGKVKRPMWYEVKKNESVNQLLKYTGGFTGDAYTKRVRVTRKSGDTYTVHSIDEFKMGSFTLMDEDVMEVDSVRMRFENTVEIRGAVKHAGQYQLGGDIQTVRELLLAADGLREDAYLKSAVMHREKPDRTLEMVSVDLEAIMQGNATDIPLKNGDMLFIPSQTEMLGDLSVRIMGEVNYPGSYPYADNTSLKDLILMAGGMTNAGSLAKVDIFRRVRDANAVQSRNISAQAFSFSLDEAFNLIQDTVFNLSPFDIVVIHKSPSYEEQQNITVTGEVNFQGQYTMLTKNYRLSDLIKACGGITSQAYVRGAHLTRLMTSDEIDHRDRANRQAQILLYENVLKEGKEMNMSIADSLLAMKMNTEYTFPVSINLEKAIANPGSSYDLVLRHGDHLEIPEQSDIIKVSGEVMYPVSMSYEKGRNLSYYISHAGGYSGNAHRSKVYGIHANGSVVRLRSHSERDIQPGMEIVIPQKAAKKKMSTTEVVGITSAVASIGAIVVTLISTLKK